MGVRDLDRRRGAASWSALGTTIELRVTERRALERARASVERELAAIDLACSHFRTDSELSRANRAGGRPLHVSELLMEALELAVRAAELSGGDVDPTVGGALELACEGATPAGPAVTVRRLAGWRALELDRRRRTLRVPAGVRLDLGASAKAWAADRTARAAADAGGCGALVSVGGDLATFGEAPPGGWRVHVTDDHRSGASAPGQTIAIFDGALATSSIAVRQRRRGGRTLHHIVDPRTRLPVETCWRTVSVAAASCAEANVASTAALVRGRSALDWIAGMGLPARLVDRAGVCTHVGAWPAPLEAAA